MLCLSLLHALLIFTSCFLSHFTQWKLHETSMEEMEEYAKLAPQIGEDFREFLNPRFDIFTAHFSCE